jgi:hypothetical protein
MEFKNAALIEGWAVRMIDSNQSSSYSVHITSNIELE